MKVKKVKISERLSEFQKALFGMFVHWGLYARLGRGEWVMYKDRIPQEEYARLAEDFQPRHFDPDRWCRVAKAAGMKYIVFTTRHHDGFALFDSNASDFTSMKTVVKRDFVRDFVAAARRNGLKVGLYYSLGDWHFGLAKISDSPEKDRAWEVCMTMGGNTNCFWGWSPYNPLAKTTGQLIGHLTKTARLGGNFLLNVSPDGDGRLPDWQLERLKKIGKWMKIHSEAVFDVGPSNRTMDANYQTGSSCGICADNGKAIYHYLYLWPGEKAIVPVVKGQVTGTSLLTTGQRLKFERDQANRLIVSGLPATSPDPYCPVLKIEVSC